MDIKQRLQAKVLNGGAVTELCRDALAEIERLEKAAPMQARAIIAAELLAALLQRESSSIIPSPQEALRAVCWADALLRELQG